MAKVSFITKQNKCGGQFLQHTPPEATSSQNSGLLHNLFHKVQGTTAVLHRSRYSSSVVFHADNTDTHICCAKFIQLYLSQHILCVLLLSKQNLSPKAFHVYIKIVFLFQMSHPESNVWIYDTSCSNCTQHMFRKKIHTIMAGESQGPHKTWQALSIFGSTFSIWCLQFIHLSNSSPINWMFVDSLIILVW